MREIDRSWRGIRLPLPQCPKINCIICYEHIYNYRIVIILIKSIVDQLAISHPWVDTISYSTLSPHTHVYSVGYLCLYLLDHLTQGTRQDYMPCMVYDHKCS